jgi:adenylylsulfate kinase
VDQNLFWHESEIRRVDRERRNSHRGCALWFTGLSSAGKSSLAFALEMRLFRLGCGVMVLDGDNIRHGLCSDLSFSPSDRHENMRRVGEVLSLFVDAGMIALAAFVSPYRADRDRVRARLGNQSFMEIYCRCPVEVCERRDRKGLYRRAREGEIAEFTGISAPYEAPLAPDLELDTANDSIEHCISAIMDRMRARGLLGAPAARSDRAR